MTATTTAVAETFADLAIPGVEVSDVGLSVLDPSLPFESYERLFDVAGRVGDAARWWVGDLLLFGDRRYGEPYAQVLSGARVSERQVSRYRWVCERVARSRRRGNLSFSHHEEVAPLEPAAQIRLLDQATARGWTVRELREHVQTERAIPPVTPPPPTEPTAVVENLGTAGAGLAQQRRALELVYRHLRGDEGVDPLEVAESIPPALKALEHASEVVIEAEKRLARPSFREHVERAVKAATRSSGFAMIPDADFDAMVEALREEQA